MDAGQTIRNIQAETGRYVGCLEELAFNQGWLTARTGARGWARARHDALWTVLTVLITEGIK